MLRQGGSPPTVYQKIGLYSRVAALHNKSKRGEGIIPSPRLYYAAGFPVG
jgi:hypothetical protein